MNFFQKRVIYTISWIITAFNQQWGIIEARSNNAATNWYEVKELPVKFSTTNIWAACSLNYGGYEGIWSGITTWITGYTTSTVGVGIAGEYSMKYPKANWVALGV